MATLELTRTDFFGKVDISPNVADSKLDVHINHAKEFDLRDLLGKELYDDIIASASTSEYDELIEHLKPVLVYYASARLVRNLDINITAFGMRNKMHEYSEPVSSKMITMQATEYESTARSYWNRAVEYLDRSNIALWKTTRCGQERTKKMSGAKIYAPK